MPSKCESITLPDERQAVRITLPIDPSTLSTAQQKKVSFRTRRIFTNKRVASGMKAVEILARPFKGAVESVVPHRTPAFLYVAFYHAYPKGTPKRELVPNAPMPCGADNDNRIKAPQDALVNAGWFADDSHITTTLITKRRTLDRPRIVITVAPDL